MIKRVHRSINGINSYINPSDFYADDSEKTNINWMCYKYATYIIRNIDDSLLKKMLKAGIRDDGVSKFCTIFGKSSKNVILNMIEDKPVSIYWCENIIKEHYPAIRKNLVDTLCLATINAWGQFFRECSAPIDEWIPNINGKTCMFDDH